MINRGKGETEIRVYDNRIRVYMMDWDQGIYVGRSEGGHLRRTPVPRARKDPPGPAPSPCTPAAKGPS